MSLPTAEPGLEEDAALAVAAARAGGRVLLERRGYEAHVKEDRTSIVTATDLASQAVITETIRAVRPRDAIIGEEGVDGEASARRAWIVDPLDGTTNYAGGFPFSCVSVALRRDGEVVAGAVVAPTFGEVFAARRGGGATLGGKPISTSQTAELGQALAATGLQSADEGRIAAHAARVAQLHRAVRGVRMPGSPALSLCYVACGRLDAFLEEGLKPWDVAAGLLILTEAGGSASGLSGEPLSVSGHASLLASNGSVHESLVRRLGASP